MIDPELLEKLVAFQKYGTLSATADHLLVTQPTVTRSMKKLEEQLGVALFDRSISNRIKLNDTGVLAATEAQKLLQAHQDFEKRIQNFAHQQSELQIGGVMPGPSIFATTLQPEITVKFTVDFQPLAPEAVVDELLAYKKHLIFVNDEINNSEIESMYLGVECLGVALDNFNPLAQHASVSFKELAGLSFLVGQNIGPWRSLIEDCIPNANFLYQEKFTAVNELSKYSNFPFFFSNLSKLSKPTATRFSPSRTKVMIEDPNNAMEVYVDYRKQDRHLVQPLLKTLAQKWPQ